MKKNSAFSLIELSIVILIIGILIAGVTQASRLVKQFKIKTAQTITQSSPVSGIKNLIAWYETSMDTSFFTSETNEGGLLSTWRDINPQSISKINATQTTADNQPNYTTSLGLPLVSFVDQDYFNLPDGTVPYGNSSYTVFFVSRLDALCTCGILGSGAYDDPSGSTNAFRYAETGNFVNYWWGDDALSPTDTIIVKKLQIFTVSYDQATRKIYVDGTMIYNNAPGIVRDSTTANNTIGTSFTDEYLANGYIGEIIIFDRALATEERKSIESYLGKKFSIKVN